MIKYKDRKQLTFDELPSWKGHLSEKKVKKLEKTWAGPFREFVTPNLPIEQIAKVYSPDQGRPTKELGMVIGAVVLQQIHDLTDEQTIDQLSFNQQWHFALDVFDPNEHVISGKTLWTMRQLMIRKDLSKPLFDIVTDAIANRHNVDSRQQRIDSTIIRSNIARMGRIRILSTVIKKFLNNLKRHHQEVYQQLHSGFDRLEHYLKNPDNNYFGNVKPSESSSKLIDIAGDLYYLIQRFSRMESITRMHSYALLVRVFSEHCRLDQDQVSVKPNKEVPSDSIQNPADIDATYDGYKKNSGYQLQVMETYKSQEEKPSGQPVLNLITHIAVDPAHNHDSNAIEPALADVTGRDQAPQVLLADTAYGGDDNVEMARDSKIEMIAPVPGKKNERSFEGIDFNPDTREVISCMAGKAPDQKKWLEKRKRFVAIWNHSTCQGCPMQDQCIVPRMKRGNRLNYSAKDVRLWMRRVYEETAAFSERYRYRSGVEASVSHLIHETGARRLRYRGIARVTFAEVFKALGLNIFRTARYIQKSGYFLENGSFSFVCDVKKRLLDIAAKFMNPLPSMRVFKRAFA